MACWPCCCAILWSGLHHHRDIRESTCFDGVAGVGAEHGHIKALAVHFYGNYTVQDLLDATGKLREAATRMRQRSGAPKEALDRLLGTDDSGQDSLGARPLLESDQRVPMRWQAAFPHA